jgi:hypothetical protein
MTAHVIDRRKNGNNKSSSNRQRFVKRVNRHIKEAIRENIKNGNIKDIADTNGQSVTVPKKDIHEPWFHHGKGGDTERVYPGNKEYVPGDTIEKPDEDGGGGSGSGVGQGGGDDDFQFMISKKEYLDIFFEDLELPDMVKKQLSTIVETKLKRSGYSITGTPGRLNYIRSLKQSIGRRSALRGPKKKLLKELEEKLALLLEDCSLSFNEIPRTVLDEIESLKAQIIALKKKIKAVPFIDTFDLRYNRFELVSVPTTRAVMFMLMDVSGSMDEHKKEMAKRFYMLLYLFLHRIYEHIDIVPIRYHTEAKEVDEQEFFYSPESGGTMVSPALELAKEIMHERYSGGSWNIYFCHTSDGDNYSSDRDDCIALLDDLLPYVQYYAYIQIGADDNDLSEMFINALMPVFNNIDVAVIHSPEDIFPVFRKLFEKETT